MFRRKSALLEKQHLNRTVPVIYLHFQIQVREHECKWNICQCISNTTVRSHVFQKLYEHHLNGISSLRSTMYGTKMGIWMVCCMHLRIILRELSWNGKPKAWARVEWLQCVASKFWYLCLETVRRSIVNQFQMLC